MSHSRRWWRLLHFLGIFHLLPIKITYDARAPFAVAPRRRLALALWTALYIIALYFVHFVAIRNDDRGCLDAMLRSTFRIYNVRFVTAMYGLSGLFTNAFCIYRIYRSNVVSMLTKSFNLNASLGLSTPKTIDNKFKVLFYTMFVPPWFNTLAMSCYCTRKKPLVQLLRQAATNHFAFLIYLPVFVTATVFYILLDIVEECLELICQHVNMMAALATPKPFLQTEPYKGHTTTTRFKLDLSRIFYLRIAHYEAVSLANEIMASFQLDILAIFVMAFYHNVMLNYALVFNSQEALRSLESAIFVCLSLTTSFTLMAGLWVLCAGPSRIQVQQRKLMNCVSRLSASCQPPYDNYVEIRLFQVQSRNHTANFKVFGMFKANLSLLFTMCASIISYIVILIQFAIDPETTAGVTTVSSMVPTSVSTINTTIT